MLNLMHFQKIFENNMKIYSQNSFYSYIFIIKNTFFYLNIALVKYSCHFSYDATKLVFKQILFKVKKFCKHKI